MFQTGLQTVQNPAIDLEPYREVCANYLENAPSCVKVNYSGKGVANKRQKSQLINYYSYQIPTVPLTKPDLIKIRWIDFC